MLKRLILASLAVAFVGMQASLAMAANPDTGPGCGLGKLAWQQEQGVMRIRPAGSAP